MDDQRTELGLTWREVAALAKMTYEGLRSVRNGSGGIPKLTRRKLETALRWPNGEIDRILGQPGSVASADIPREWTPDELQQLRQWSLDELIEEGRRKIKTHGERYAAQWLKDAAARKSEMLSREDSPL
ncbi:hypothetical protein [Amycolatopsis tolypomycina]|uniref:hypothetical protein n=1 Tax=Amycolatopsis tolypomycina TaxID=208445 RepID=UPI0033AC1EDD